MTSKHCAVVLVACAMLATSGCSKRAESASVRCKTIERWDELADRYLTPENDNIPTSILADWCVRRASYLLARSSDPPASVTKAAVLTCEAAIARDVDHQAAVVAKRHGAEARDVYPQVEAVTRAGFDDVATVAIAEARAFECWRNVRDDAPVGSYMGYTPPKKK